MDATICLEISAGQEQKAAK